LDDRGGGEPPKRGRVVKRKGTGNESMTISERRGDRELSSEASEKASVPINPGVRKPKGVGGGTDRGNKGL